MYFGPFRMTNKYVAIKMSSDVGFAMNGKSFNLVSEPRKEN